MGSFPFPALFLSTTILFAVWIPFLSRSLSFYEIINNSEVVVLVCVSHVQLFVTTQL